MQQPYPCPACNKLIAPGSKFCPSCGRPLIRQEVAYSSQPLYSCPRCKTTMRFGVKACSTCGLKLVWEQPQQTSYSWPERKDRAEHAQGSNKTGVLKWVWISMLSLLLLLSLCVFGTAFMLKQSVLNPRFVTSEVQKLELAAITNDFISRQTGGNIPAGIEDALYSTVYRLEPHLKAGLNSSLISIYDYLLDKRDDPRMSSLLKNTFLSVDFLTELIDEVHIMPLAKPIINAQVAQWIPSGMEFLNAYIAPVVDEILVNQEPWIKEQLKAAAGPIADYLLSEIDHFSIKISTRPVLDNLREILRRDIAKLPIPQLSGLPSYLVEMGFDQYFDEFAKSIPASLEIDESLIGSSPPAEIKSALAKAEKELGTVRGYISTFKLVYILLIVFMLLLLLGIFLILRDAKGITRSLGIIFLLYGIIQFVLFLVLGNYLSTQISGLSGIPMHLQAWLEGFVHNALAPWQVMGIGSMTGGLVLVAVSFFLRSQEEDRIGKHPDL